MTPTPPGKWLVEAPIWLRKAYAGLFLIWGAGPAKGARYVGACNSGPERQALCHILREKTHLVTAFPERGSTVRT